VAHLDSACSTRNRTLRRRQLRIS